MTATFNGAAAFVDVRVLEYSGLDTSSPLDVTAEGTGRGTSPGSASASTTAANELIFGAGMTDAQDNSLGPENPKVVGDMYGIRGALRQVRRLTA